MPININEKPLQTVQNLLEAFPNSPVLLPKRNDFEVPIGIEIEVPWKAYFPDLWKPGFPNLDEGEMFMIYLECREREKILLPQLQKTVDCGVPKGADRYWEFAFDPVLDPSITCNQVAILEANHLLPFGPHSLHITLGGLKVDKNTVFLALLLESLSSSSKRIMSAFHDSVISKGWARKGFAGTFEKEGEHDVQHGYETAAEIRILELPKTIDELYTLMIRAQIGAKAVRMTQEGKEVQWWNRYVAGATKILQEHGLPNKNWKKPHKEPEIWQQFADQYESISSAIQRFVLEPGGLF